MKRSQITFWGTEEERERLLKAVELSEMPDGRPMTISTFLRTAVFAKVDEVLSGKVPHAENS